MKFPDNWVPLYRLLLGFSCLLPASFATAQPASQPSITSKTQVIQPMNSLNATIAFFYQQPVVLNRDQHKDLRLQAGDARFAAHNQAVPLVVTELPEAALEYPIVFAKGSDGRWLLLALTGLQAGHNAFVNEHGQWTARYVPASVRRYPFILAENGADQLSLAADLAAPHFGEQGQPLFDEQGEPTELARNVMALLAEFQQQTTRTHALGQALEDAQLLSQQNLQVRLGDGREALVEGVWIVDEAKLRALPDDKALAWFKDGQLAVIYAQMLSLRNLVPLLERSQPGPASPSNPSSKADVKAKASQAN